jgi:uncharacterized lipoprotein YajG
MKRLIPLFVSVAAATSGCAFVAQQASVHPVVSIKSSSVGADVSVAVRVVDERPTKVLGHRGTALSSAAEITSAEDVATVVHKEIVAGLQKKGFSVADYSEGSNSRLTVEVRLLEYTTSTGFWTGGVDVHSALKAIAIRDGHTYEKVYRSETKERVLVVPTAETNEKWINDTLGAVLAQLLDDEALMTALARGS